MTRIKKFLSLVNHKKRKSLQHGFSILELLVTIGLFAVFLPALMVGFAATREGRPQLEQRMKATALVREGEEAVRVIRDTDWENIVPNGTFYPKIDGSNWKLDNISYDPVTGFHRKVVITDVYRDTSGNIVNGNPSPLDKIDLSIKKVTTTVSWDTPHASEVTSVMYLTRFGNDSTTQTTQGQFDNGTHDSSISVTKDVDGEIKLGSNSGGGDWCQPNLTITALDLTRQSIPTAISATYKNVYTATGVNASGDSLDHIGVTDTTYPTAPAATEVGYYNNYKSYGLYADPVTSRVYITSDHPGLTVDIVNGSTNSKVSSFTDSGGENGLSVFVSGNTGYVTTEKSNGSSTTLYSFDTTKTPAKELGKISLVGSGKKIIVVGQYAYVVTANTTKQLQIIDVSDPKNMQPVTTLTMGNNAPGVYLSVDDAGKTAYLVTSYVSASKPDAFIIDLTTRTVTRSYNTNGMNPKGVALIPGGWMIVVGAGGSQQYQVFRTTDATQSPCGGLTSANGSTAIYAIDYVKEPDGEVFSYILTDNSNKEFQIIQGGAGGPGTGYQSTGTYTSSVINPGRTVAFNTFSVNAYTPPGTIIFYKVAIKPGIAGSCDGVTFMPNDFKTFPPGVLPLTTYEGYSNPGQCLKYQVTLQTSDPNVTPTLYDISFNYSL